MLITNETTNVDDSIIPLILKFGDDYGSITFCHDRILSCKYLVKGSDGSLTNFDTKSDLVNNVKRWHITHLLEYQVQWPTSIFIEL